VRPSRDNPEIRPVLATASLALGLLATGAFLYGYLIESHRAFLSAASGIGLLLAGWAGLLLSLFLSIIAIARQEGPRANAAFVSTLVLLAMPFITAIGWNVLSD
jgi:hypothetical protein